MVLILNEHNYVEVITSYSSDKWKPLLDLIPEIEKTKAFSSYVPGELSHDNVHTLGYLAYEKVVEDFIKVVYDNPVIISFEWAEWEEGRQMAKDKHFDFDKISIPEKCKLISAIVRNDRFCEGVLISAFESGLILKLLKSIERQLRLSGIISNL